MSKLNSVLPETCSVLERHKHTALQPKRKNGVSHGAVFVG